MLSMCPFAPVRSTMPSSMGVRLKLALDVVNRAVSNQTKVKTAAGRMLCGRLELALLHMDVELRIAEMQRMAAVPFAMLHAEHAFVEGKALCEILRRDDDVVDVLDVHSIFSLLVDELLIFILS